jgi:20S proteasome subunit alpha 2
VIATEKKLASPLMDEASINKIQLLCEHVGAVYSGLGPDFRLLSQMSRKLIQKYWVEYLEPITCATLCREAANLIQEKTQAGGYRPFGVSVLVAGYDETGPHLTQLDPSGAYYSWKAAAIGKNAKNAKAFLEKRYSNDMEIEDAIHNALLTLKEGFEGTFRLTQAPWTQLTSKWALFVVTRSSAYSLRQRSNNTSMSCNDYE